MLLDSNIIIYSTLPENEFLRNFISENNVFCSRVSCLEVMGYHLVSDADKKQFEIFFSLIPILEIDILIIEKAIKLRQSIKLSLGDSIIAATALFYDIPLVTRNTKDFKKIEDLLIIDPFI